jgi:Sulfatase-modifying factor enzyme 1
MAGGGPAGLRPGYEAQLRAGSLELTSVIAHTEDARSACATPADTSKAPTRFPGLRPRLRADADNARASLTPDTMADAVTPEDASSVLARRIPHHAEAARGGVLLERENRQISPVGSFKPNKFGLYDMVGNVWQWVQDCLHDDYKGAPTDGSEWTSEDCSRRVVRGGAWSSNPLTLRSAYRSRYTTGRRNNDLSFRVARTLTP